MTHGVTAYADGCRCFQCREAMRLYKRDWVAKHRASGVCARCTAPAVPGRKHCAIHLAKDRAWKAQRKQKAVAA